MIYKQTTRAIFTTAILPVFVFYFLFLAATTYAADQPSPCDFTESAKRLADAKQNASFAEELSVRREMLAQVADCSREEAENAMRTLGDINVSDDDLARSKGHLAERFRETIDYANAQKLRTRDVGFSGANDVARALKEWRNNVYLPAHGNVENLSLWQKNRDAISVAERRLEQISQTISSLKLSDREEIKNLREDATQLLREAREKNNTAHRSLSRLERPDEIGSLMRDSLDYISQSYQKFFDISEEVKKILPL